MNDIKVKPMTFFKSFWYFFVSSLLIYLGLYVLTPRLLERGVPFLVAYLTLFYAPFVLLFLTALIEYRREGNVWNLRAFKTRMRLNPLKKTDWFWIIGIILFYLIAVAAATPLMNKMAQIPIFSPPDFFPAEINPNKISVPGYMMNYKLSGQYWVIAVYFIGWFFNIFGEEFLWRGIILPRQLEKYGSNAWVVHSIFWGLWHFFWKWQLVILLPIAFLITYAVYRCKNTWVGIISHGLLNAIPLIMIINSVFS
ncbi:lysostaphin resistance A-like protein [Enterococcus sp. DIV0756]|uniref:CPBP family intramembrane glutamic endopeptidase n=1 Tax=Enterococcus sp. DIV0756 TaxID=2774636 RepID=UPI003F25138D